MPRMNPEIKRIWVEALRSGEYPQTEEGLRDDHGFCCLGVLCDLSVKAGVAKENRVYESIWAYDGEMNYLPESVYKWAGLMDGNPMVKVPESLRKVRLYKTRTLSGLNDDGVPFTTIADVIEESL